MSSIILKLLFMGVKNITKVSDCLYDLGVKGQGHTYLKLIYCSNDKECLFHFLIEGVRI